MSLVCYIAGLVLLCNGAMGEILGVQTAMLTLATVAAVELCLPFIKLNVQSHRGRLGKTISIVTNIALVADICGGMVVNPLVWLVIMWVLSIFLLIENGIEGLTMLRRLEGVTAR